MAFETSSITLIFKLLEYAFIVLMGANTTERSSFRLQIRRIILSTHSGISNSSLDWPLKSHTPRPRYLEVLW